MANKNKNLARIYVNIKKLAKNTNTDKKYIKEIIKESLEIKSFSNLNKIQEIQILHFLINYNLLYEQNQNQTKS
jgi:predicted regulator of amino acid metabolism with ACT domain